MNWAESNANEAMAVNEFGGPDKLTLHTLPVPVVDAGEVLIRIETAGVGIWDTMEREGKLLYNEVHFPRVLGGEFQVRIAQTFPLEEAVQAQEAMKKHYLGKIVLRVSGE
jgi:NADPH:quinone reductase-like Zn-dependent oxidoreductase